MANKINQTKKEIKVIEGVDYTKFDTNLLSDNKKLHKTNNNKDNIVVEQQYMPIGYNVENVEEKYLSINFYTGAWNFCSVYNFEKRDPSDQKEEDRRLGYYSMRYILPEGENLKPSILQIRIYKNKKISFVVKSASGRIFIKNNKNHGEEVFSNEEIETKALDFTKTFFIDNKSWLLPRKVMTDLKKRIIYNCYRDENSEEYKFTEETKKTVENFLEYNVSENKEIKEFWEKRFNTDGISSLPLMYQYIYENLKKKNALKKSKQQIYEELIETAGMKNFFENPKEYEGKVFWNRVGDEIIAFYTSSPTWKDGNYAYFFSFNTKTKKKKYGEYSYSLKDWSFPVASSKFIYNNFEINNKEVVILNNLSTKQLFAGTNCGWILTYAPNCLYKKIYSKEAGFINELINEKKMESVCIKILLSTTEPILELLLQAKLFNLYFICLNQKMGSYADCFDFKELKPGEVIGENNNYSLPYYGKGTNLKKMTGICISNLRILDSKLEPEFVKEYRNEYWKRNYIQFHLFKCLFDKDLLTVDSQLFDKSLTKWIEWKETNGRGYLEEVGLLLKDKMSFDQKLDYISKYERDGGYVDSISKDYLISRAKLEKLSKSRPELANIFSKKEYPFAPGKAIKFFRYVPEEYGSENNFMKQYANKYKAAMERGDFEFNFPKKATEKEGLDLLGCTVVLTPREHLELLHDKATHWVTFYQDVGKEEEFAEAVERVKPLEWEDKDTGLCIIAPKKVADIRNEGEVLSHCVATYIDPIINGTENIMLLRRMDMPDHPYFTVEVCNDGSIRQVHCYRNLCLTAEDQQRAYEYSEYEVYNKTFDIVGFLLKWAKAMKGKIKASSIHEQYGALCAQR